MSQQRAQKGFAGLELLLILVAVTIIGFTGYFMYHANQKTGATLDSASKVAQSSPHATLKKKTTTSSTSTGSTLAQSYVTLTEWGVRAPYSGPLTLTYVIRSGSSDRYADFTSKELLALDPECTPEFGGLIGRYLATDTVNSDLVVDSSETVAQYAASVNKADFGHVGNYYYFFTHTQAGCGTDTTKTFPLEQQTNDAVKSIVPNLEAIPSN